MIFRKRNVLPRSVQRVGRQGLTSQLTVVGCGAVGMAITYSILQRSLVGELVLADIDRNKLEGEVMDLNHSGGFLHADVKMAGEGYEGTEHSDVIIITAGVRQREGESRRSLLDRNVAVFRAIIPPLVAKSPDTLLLVRPRNGRRNFLRFFSLVFCQNLFDLALSRNEFFHLVF